MFGNSKKENDFEIESTVEEGMNKLRNLDRRPSSNIYRIGVNGEQHIHFVTTEAQMAPNLILSTCSWVKIHVFFKTINEIYWLLYKTVVR